MRSIVAVLAVALAMVFSSVGPGRAGEAEVNLLRSYIGTWAGQSVLTGGDQPEAFSCRLAVTQGRLVKINYAGRCTLVNMNLSVTGTISFNDEANRYEATMRSNVGFSAAAVGMQKGKTIVFVLRERQADRGGGTMEVDSVLELTGSRIAVDFNVEFNRSGQVLTAKVPFQRN
jgi:hypothetical protein